MNEILQRFGTSRVITMAGIGLGLMTFFGYIMVRANQTEMALLYNEIEAAEGGRVLEKLKTMGIPFEVKGDGTQIYAPIDDISRLRMELAQSGMPSGGGVGYEIFDKQDILGTTNALLGINQIRALEGELGKSIQTIQGIQAARVHLVIPKRELFSENKQEPSASVMIRMKGVAVLSATQVQSIRYLVASAVPGLILDQVSIVDDRGNLLARGKDSAETKDNLTMQQTTQREYEQRISRSIEALLDRTLGLNKTRVEVSVDMDFDQVSSTSVLFDPEGQVVKNQIINEEGVSTSEKSASSDAVSIQNSLPVGQEGQGNTGNNNKNQTSNIEENINYEISNTTKTYVKELGTIKRLSIAVMVDGNYKKKNDGTQEYQPRSDEELNKLKDLVKTATGYKEDRGDVVSLVNLKFSELPQDTIPEKQENPFFGLNLNKLAELSITALVVLIGLFTVVKPFISSLMRTTSSRSLSGNSEILSDSSTKIHVENQSNTNRSTDSKQAQPPINIDHIEGMVNQSSTKKIAELVDRHPEEAVSIIRSWMYSDK
ncbi:MAG: flagellar basal-body MS-ring/collar protein FliF [Proteobacteria bacterium]|nr:flagellar basal-body MS-ring/collar protein FliF [Pseudomonadota bacterium]